MLYWLTKGRAVFKSLVAQRVRLNAQLLPYRNPLVEYLRAERRLGRKIVLATAAHASIAEGVARHLGLFDLVIATSDTVNLKGEKKLARLRQAVGDRFVYAGDSRADLPIWRAAQGAILVDVSSAVARSVRAAVPVEREIRADGSGWDAWVGALRVHQWLKNLLLFVPLFTAFEFSDPEKLASTVLAFIALSLGASATYIGNDLWDLDSDRLHPRKRDRPFASGRLPIAHGLACAIALLLLASVLAVLVTPAFAVALLAYLVLTTAYSCHFKRYALADVILLALLYTLRVIAGSGAASVPVSRWLLAFSVFSFLSLALVKRCAELISLRGAGRAITPGRDYRIGDLEVLWPVGISSAMAAVIVFCMFISAPETLPRYATPSLLWLAAVGLIYLFFRLWLVTVRGAMHDDPLVHLLENRGTLCTLLATAAIIVAAHFISIF